VYTQRHFWVLTGLSAPHSIPCHISIVPVKLAFIYCDSKTRERTQKSCDYNTII
jgi:hypothetical protein